ncbi:hypothetical protein [Phenylobacterium sp.]|uniref:hypothetical protein n=1 Tax=Phenylobacterium sp. TaxID=1871053 RepID=UPI002609B445|nr:hypothetical protein [Phenylobacterium sp.]
MTSPPNRSRPSGPTAAIEPQARRGRKSPEARAKYDAALPYAPKWRALLDARAAAAGHLPRSG